MVFRVKRNFPGRHATSGHFTMLTALVVLVVMTSLIRVTQADLALENANWRRLYDVRDNGEFNEKSLCQTQECIATAARILTSLDPKTNPCDDFYKFSCGGWINNQILPPHRQALLTLYDTDKHLATVKRLLSPDAAKCSNLTSVTKAKQLFASCMKYATRTEVDDTIVRIIQTRFGEWPLAAETWDGSDFDLKTFLIKAARLNVHPLIRLEVSLFDDIRDGKFVIEHMLSLKEPDLGLPVRHYSDDNIVFKMYMAKIYADSLRFGPADVNRTLQDISDILEVEKTLIKLIHDGQGSSPATYTLQELQDEFSPLLDWRTFVTTIASSPKIGITDITDNEVFLTQLPFYLSFMIKYFGELPDRTQANYIIWRVVDCLQNDLVHDKKQIDKTLNSVIHGTTALPSPEESCITYISTTFNLVVHRLLYTDKLPPSKIIQVYDILKRIQREFDEIISEKEWVDQTTARLIREKNAALVTTLVDYELSMNDTLLEDYYINVTIAGDNFVENVVIEREEAFARNMRLLRQPYQKLLETLPHELVARNYRFLNKVEISSILLESPMFTCDVPMALNYGGIGSIFGHEILHSHDTVGAQFSTEGVHGVWWSNYTLSIFEERQQCFIDQYEHFFLEKAGQFLNGSMTLNDNIADNGGLNLAYRAYRRHVAEIGKSERVLPGVYYSQDQLFFINFAQIWCDVYNVASSKALVDGSHSPGQFRVIGSVQNSEDFARAFSCPVGSLMNPKNKCGIW